MFHFLNISYLVSLFLFVFIIIFLDKSSFLLYDKFGNDSILNLIKSFTKQILLNVHGVLSYNNKIIKTTKPVSS